MLALVFQLAQVLPAAVLSSPCQATQESCECCAGARTCDCAENSDPDQKPAPVPPAPRGELKVPAVKPAEINVAVVSLHDPELSVTATFTPLAGSVSGYTGVRLSVAFCSFVI
jgi:hypothetical protein